MNRSHRRPRLIKSHDCTISSKAKIVWHAKNIQQRQLTGRDVIYCKESDADVTIDVPLLRLAVWLTAVVHESRIVAFRSSVDNTETIKQSMSFSLGVYQIVVLDYSAKYE